jgi:hypothetical protein
VIWVLVHFVNVSDNLQTWSNYTTWGCIGTPSHEPCHDRIAGSQSHEILWMKSPRLSWNKRSVNTHPHTHTCVIDDWYVTTRIELLIFIHISLIIKILIHISQFNNLGKTELIVFGPKRKLKTINWFSN